MQDGFKDSKIFLQLPFSANWRHLVCNQFVHCQFVVVSCNGPIHIKRQNLDAVHLFKKDVVQRISHTHIKQHSPT